MQRHASVRSLINRQPSSLSNLGSPSSTSKTPSMTTTDLKSKESTAITDEQDVHHKMPNFAVLAALQAMRIEASIGLAILTDTDHLFLMRTSSRPPHLSGDILRTSGLKVYEVINQTGHRLYFAVVIPTQCLRTFWVCPNSFVAYIVDSYGDELLRIEADSGYCGSNSVVIAKSSTEVYGRVRQEGECCTPDYSLLNKNDDPLIKVRPSAAVNCFNFCIPVDYVVYHGEFASKIGVMNTKWYNTGVLPEVFSSNHIRLYGVNFPMDIDIPSKILLLTTLLMVKIFRNEF